MCKYNLGPFYWFYCIHNGYSNSVSSIVNFLFYSITNILSIKIMQWMFDENNQNCSLVFILTMRLLIVLIVFLHTGNHHSISYEWTEIFLKYAFKNVQIHGISRCRTEYQKPYLSSSFFVLVSIVNISFSFLSCILKPQQSPATNSYKFWFIYQLLTSFYLSSVIH